MNSKIHRCGYCGQPVDSNGIPLEDEAREKAIRILETYGDHHTHKEHGECCIHEVMMQEERKSMRQVTREMAHDAGMTEIEGTWIKW